MKKHLLPLSILAAILILPAIAHATAYHYTGNRVDGFGDFINWIKSWF